MRKHLLSLLVLLLAGFGLARGQSNYDFYHVSGDDTLYFKYTSINTCKLVPPSLYNDWYGYTQPSGYVSIPDTVNYVCLVTEIAPNAFYGCTGITRVYVPPTIAAVGESAFQNCSYLNEIYFDSSTHWTLSLDTIGPNAFAGCTRIDWCFFCSTLEAWMNVGLGNAASNPMSSVYRGGICLYGYWGNPPDRVDVPRSIHKIKKYSFYNWHGIRKITMSDTLVTSIGDSAFFGIRNLDSLWIGHGVTHIGAGAFQNSGVDWVRMGNSVSSIGERAFQGCSSLLDLTLPSITTVPNHLCDGCSHLHSIVIPNQVTTIGDYAFYGCSDMASLTLGNHVSSIGGYAFYGCGRLLSVTIPRSVQTIGYAAFRNNSFLSTLNFNADSCSSVDSYWLDGCNRLANVNIGNHVKRIPANFVRGRTTLTNIVIPDSVVVIGGSAFSGCAGLTSMTIPNSVVTIGGSAFTGCTGLTSMTIPNSVVTIGGSAFSGCTGLTSMTIPNSVVTIDGSAFSGCTGMSTLTIGKSVSSIGDRAFQNCTGLDTVNFNADSCISMCSYSYSSNSYYRAFVGCTNISTLNIGNSVKRIPDYAFMDCSNLGSLAIPDSVITIGQYAFSGCTGISTLTIGKAVSSIGNYAFQNCTGLDTVNFNADSCISMCSRYYSYERAFVGCTNISTLNIGNSVKRIPDYAFMACSNLGAVIIPDSVKTIGQYAFSGCTGVSTLTIGKSVSSIGNSAFQNDTLIATVNFNADSLLTTGVFSGRTNISTLNIGSNVKSIPSSTFSGCTGISTLTIGKAVSSIGNYAFQNCTGLDTVNFNADSCISMCSRYYSYERAFVGCTNISTLNIGSSVKRIPDYAFMDCSNLVSLAISDSVKTIGQSAFSGCTGITSLDIPNSVVTIGQSAFSGCTGITSLDIPNSVVTIGGAAFSDCTGLTSLTIPNSVVTIGGGAFYRCTGLTSLAIPNSVVTIGGSAFCDCTSLTSLTIPNSVVTIGGGAFRGCTGLTSLTIGNAVSSIGEYAFNEIYYLDTITIHNPIPPTLGRSAFDYSSQTKVFVPCHASAAYRADAGWRQFSQIYEQECRLYDFWAVAPSGDTLYYSIQNSNSVKVVRPNEAGWGNATRPTGSVIIPPTVMNEGVTYNVTSIGEAAFYSCTSMTEVTIPNTIDSIEEGAFYYCSGLTTVNFNADSCIYAGSSDIRAFYGCTNFAHLNIGSNVKRIPSYAFRSCTHLDTVTIPASVSTIGYNAFYGCTGLTTVYFNADSCTNAGYDPNNDWIYFVFGGCPNFTTLNIADDVKLLPSFAFWNCSGLQHVVVPNSVHSIGRMTFRGCTSLSTIEIGSGVSVIDDYAFYSCTNLLELVSHNPVPPVVYNNTFLDVPTYANVYVPCGRVPAYDSVWTWFTNIGDLRVVLSAVANDALMGSVQVLTPPSCSAAAVIEAVPNMGYSFVYWSDGDTSNPRTISMATGDTLSLVAYFVPNQYVLSVVSSDSTWGTATGSGVYAYSTTATISATPEYGFHFTSWSDGDTTNPRTIVVTRDTALTAIFGRNQYTVAVQCVSAQGTVAGAGTYLYEDTATVTATAAYGYHFTTWSDGITANPRTIVVTRDTVLTALFGRNQYTVTAQCDSAQGSATGAGTYLYEDTATITATATYGYHFTTWSDGITTNPRTIVVTRDTVLTALFGRNQYTVAVQCDSAQGTVAGAGTYLYEDTVTITATAAYGYHFTTWSDGITANPRAIVVTRDTVLTAIFGRNQYTVTAQCDSAQGTVTGAGTYLYEDTATITATAAYGYHFTTWSDGDTTNPRTIVVTRDTVLTALFGRNQYTVAVQCNSTQGAVSGAGTYLYEDTATVTATAAYGYHFTTWSDGITANPRNIVVTRDTALTAIFGRNQYTVAVQCDSTQGAVSGAGTYLYEDTATVTATAAYGYHFTEWSDGTTTNPRTIVVTCDTVLMAIFGRNQYTVTAQCDSAQGTVAGAGTYLYEDTATITATAAYGYHFTTWSDGVTANPLTIVVTSDTALTAQFDRNEYTLTVVCDETQGIVTGAGVYMFGDVARVTVAANEGFAFSYWAETGVTETAIDTVMNSDVMLTAIFDTVYHTLTLTANNPDWGTVAGGGEYAHGTEVTVSATANEGFRFTGWSDGSEENPRTVVVTADMELMANFAEQTGIADAAMSNVTLYPNPTHGVLHIEADNVLSVEVCTMDGRVMLRGSQTNSID